MDFEDLREGRVHGDLLFPLGVYEVRKVNDLFFPFHWHREIEFIFMTEGNALFHIGTGAIELQQGEGLLIPSGQLHACYPVSDHPAYFHAIVFNPQLLGSGAYDAIQSKYIEPWLERRLVWPDRFRPDSAWEQRVLHLLRDIVQQHAAQRLGFELAIKADLLAIFAELVPHGEHAANLPRNSSDTGKIERIKPVLQYMHERYKEPILIQELASLIGMSEGHFCRFFKSIVKKTPIAYLHFLRIEKSLKLLENPHIKIIDVAGEVGFESPSYFIKTFKTLKHMTPTDYRKRIVNIDN